MTAIGVAVGFVASLVPFGFILVLAFTCVTAVHHGMKRDGRAAGYWCAAAGEVIGMLALAAMVIAARSR